MRINKKTAVFSTAALCALLMFSWGWRAASYRILTATNEATILYIPTNGTYQGLIDSLEHSGVMKNIKKFNHFAQRKELAGRFRPGRYEIKKDATYSNVINKLISGTQSPVKLTFNNIRTIDRLAAVVARTLESDSATFLRALTSDSLTAAYGFTPSTFIAMFIPNTYEFYWNTSPEKFVQKMNKEYERFWSEDRLNKLKLTGLSQAEASTLASIVYEETKKSDEMPKVAGVYINRLARKMPLQADPTVKFAIGDFSLRRVLRTHLTYNSPYNTYMYAGLPPGPICMPSIKAIDAVLNYDKHNYLYFCANADFSGYHSFAVALDEHTRNAQAYTRALNRLKIYK